MISPFNIPVADELCCFACDFIIELFNIFPRSFGTDMRKTKRSGWMENEIRLLSNAVIHLKTRAHEVSS